jgi:hypothetical protein
LIMDIALDKAPTGLMFSELDSNGIEALREAYLKLIPGLSQTNATLQAHLQNRQLLISANGRGGLALYGRVQGLFRFLGTATGASIDWAVGTGWRPLLASRGGGGGGGGGSSCGVRGRTYAHSTAAPCCSPGVTLPHWNRYQPWGDLATLESISALG